MHLELNPAPHAKKALTPLQNLHIHPKEAKTNMQLAYMDERIWCWWRVILNP
jgi:hypothetical protein